MLAAAAVAASSLTATSAPVGAKTSERSDDDRTAIAWGPCDDPLLREFGAECGTLSVPLDYSDDGEGQVTLALSRVRHTVPDKDYQGIMLTNPGGPGGSGLIYSLLGGFIPGGAGAAYDWIGFDPRGVGSSEPALSCIPDYFVGPRPDYVPTSPRIERLWLARSRAYAHACDINGGELLENLRTVDNVRDMNRIRRALGEPKLNFYGFSYGTYLAQVYATLFPSRVGRMVLDSNVDPTRVWYGANLDQDYAFETVIQAFFDWVAKYDSVYHLGATGDVVEKGYYAALDDLRAKPVGPLGPAELPDAMLLAGYVQFLWPDLAQALSDLVVRGDASAVTAWYEAIDAPGDDNGYAMYLATICTDGKWPTWRVQREDAFRIAADAPFFTWGNTWFNAPCTFWAEHGRQPVDVDGTGVPPVLLVGETLDAATPFTGSLEVRRRFPQSVLLAEPGGTSHATTLSGNECVDGVIATYLATGTLPARRPGDGPDLTCQPLPEPVPVTAAASGGGGGASARTLLRRQLLEGLVG